VCEGTHARWGPSVPLVVSYGCSCCLRLRNRLYSSVFVIVNVIKKLIYTLLKGEQLLRIQIRIQIQIQIRKHIQPYDTTMRNERPHRACVPSVPHPRPHTTAPALARPLPLRQRSLTLDGHEIGGRYEHAGRTMEPYRECIGDDMFPASVANENLFDYFSDRSI
jgi:hypothetical protein